MVNQHISPRGLVTLKRTTSDSSDEKATNSKNMGKVNKLLPIMQEHLGKTIKAAMSRDMAA